MPGEYFEARERALLGTRYDVLYAASCAVRRGKNSTNATVAKHATPQEYRASTALESLFGWLYLQNRGARIEELFDVIWNALAPGFALQAE